MHAREHDDLAHHGDAVAFGEFYVDHQDVKRALFEMRQCLGLRRGLRRNCGAARIRQQVDEAATQNFGILDEQDAPLRRRWAVRARERLRGARGRHCTSSFLIA